MKGYYVIWSEDTEEFKTLRQAIKRGKEIYNAGLDYLVFIMRYDDSNPDGYFASSEAIYINELI